MNTSSQLNTTSTTSLPGADRQSSLFGSTDVTTAELVVIGAGITVGILAVGAILLRFIMPLVRKSYKKNRMLTKEVIPAAKSKHFLEPGTPSSVMSRSSRTSSRNGEWSDSGSDRTKTTYASDSTLIPQHASYGNIRNPKIAYPMYLPSSNSGSPQPPQVSNTDILNDDFISVISANSLEATNFGDAYRQNWDQTFQPYANKDSSLSYVGHPSENRSIPDKNANEDWYIGDSPMRRDWERNQLSGQAYRHDVQPTKLTRL